MRKLNLIKNIIAVLVLSIVVDINAATISQTKGDIGVIMGALVDYDLDGTSSLASESSMYIGTTYDDENLYIPGVSGHYSNATRVSIAEISLAEIASVSTNASDVLSSTLTFNFDDVVHASMMPDPVSAQSFTLEVYTANANGVLDFSDIVDDYDAGVVGTGADDLSGERIASFTFSAGGTGPWTLGEPVVGVYGPEDSFPADYGDDQFNLFGKIGFEVDVTALVAGLVADPTVDYIGFRWLSNDPGGHWTSMDGAGYLPSLTTEVVPEPATMALLLSGAMTVIRKKK